MKILFALFLCLIGGGAAYAGDLTQETDAIVQAVKDRMTCTEMSTRLAELNAIEVPTEEEAKETLRLKADYRRGCHKSAAGRRSSATGHQLVIQKQPDLEVITIEDEIANLAKTEPETTEPVAEVVSPEDELKKQTDIAVQELKNLDAGLCEDGSKPNEFGCCKDEIYKDLGDFVYACCPKTGGDCFPPIR